MNKNQIKDIRLNSQIKPNFEENLKNKDGVRFSIN
jgi:hypothetical protein